MMILYYIEREISGWFTERTELFLKKCGSSIDWYRGMCNSECVGTGLGSRFSEYWKMRIF